MHPTKPIIYDAGYVAFKNVEEFADALKSLGVEVLVDLRRRPRSKFKGFNKTSLQAELGRRGIDYIWMGELLGGFVNYATYTKTREYELGLDLLSAIAMEKRTCIMCVEEDREACHRRFIVEELRRRGFRIESLRPQLKVPRKAQPLSTTSTTNNTSGEGRW